MKIQFKSIQSSRILVLIMAGCAHVGGVHMSLVGDRRACSTASLCCFGRLLAHAT